MWSRRPRARARIGSSPAQLHVSQPGRRSRFWTLGGAGKEAPATSSPIPSSARPEANHLVGKEGNDTIGGGEMPTSWKANEGNDVLDGGNGDDELAGGRRQQHPERRQWQRQAARWHRRRRAEWRRRQRHSGGGTGKDTLVGGKGDDQYAMPIRRPSLRNMAAKATMPSFPVFSYTLGANFEDLVLLGGPRASATR